MKNDLLRKYQLTRSGLFFAAVVLGVVSIFFNQLILAVLTSVLVYYSFGDQQDGLTEKETKATDLNKQEYPRNRTVFFGAIVVLAVAFDVGVVSMSRQLDHGSLPLFFWLISIGLVFIAGVVFDKVDFLAWLKQFRSLSPDARKSFFIEISIVAAITEIAFFLRAAELDHFPVMMHGDEGEIGMEALRVLGIGNPIDPFGTGWAALPNLFFYLMAGSISIFGRNEIGVRALSALFGILCVPLTYFVGKKFWGKAAGFTAAWLIAVSHFQIHYSRLGVNCIETPFFMLLFIFFLLPPDSDISNKQREEIQSNLISGDIKFRITPYIVAGLICGLAQYIGIYSRLIPVIALLLCIVLFNRKRANLIQIAALGFAAVLAFAPLGMHYLQNPKDFTGRMDTVSIFNPDNIKTMYGQETTLSNGLFLIFKSQIIKNLNFYLQSGDGSSFYNINIPAFDFITAFLFWLGLGIVVSRIRRLPEMALVLWLVLGTVIGGVITNNAPSGTRLLTATPVVFITAGILVQRLWDTLHDFLDKHRLQGAPALHSHPEGKNVSTIQIKGLKIHQVLVSLSIFILLGALVGTMGVNMYYYFGLYPRYMPPVLPILVTREIILDAPVDHVYIMGGGEIYSNHGAIRFLSGEGAATDLRSLEDLPPLAEDGKGITILVTHSNLDQIDLIELFYPQGVATSKYFYNNLVFVKYRIPPLAR